ncbi:OmpA family protein [Chromatiaceae bacterium AAb-1]|nr:OmpA family protein [Chromatiaceae bacterium AAb-1]
MSYSFFAFWLSTTTTLMPGQYVQPAEQARWQLQGDAFRCSMQQTVAGLGQVSFVIAPDQPLTLILDILKPNLHLQQVTVAGRNADWQPAERIIADFSHPADQITPVQARFIVPAPGLLQHIDLGYWLDFELRADETAANLILPSIEGRQAVTGFRHCVADMSPLSWEQARDHQILFDAGQRTASTEDLRFLEQLVRYLSKDGSVTRILIDGHADDSNGSIANRLLSQERADDVAARLIEFGAKTGMIEVRAHGNRYPVAKTGTGGKELHNRRVLIRLIRKST